MTRIKNATIQSQNQNAIARRAVTGAVIAYILITVFLFVPGVTTNPGWPKFWMIQPLIIVPLAGAGGGIIYHFMHILFDPKGWKSIAVELICLVVYVIGLWIGTVLGLNGTLWD